MGLADLAETVEVLCHQMFYRVVGMQEAEMGVTGVGGCVCVGRGAKQAEPAVRWYGCPFMGQFNNESWVLGPMWKIRGNSTS